MTNSVCARLSEFLRIGCTYMPADEVAAVAFRIIARGKTLATQVPG